MLHNNYICLVESGKQLIKEVGSETQPENSENKATPKRVCIRPIHTPSLSHDRRIKMKNQQKRLGNSYYQEILIPKNQLQ